MCFTYTKQFDLPQIIQLNPIIMFVCGWNALKGKKRKPFWFFAKKVDKTGSGLIWHKDFFQHKLTSAYIVYQFIRSRNIHTHNYDDMSCLLKMANIPDSDSN